MSNERKSLTELAKGFRKRTLVTAKLATKLGINAMKANVLGVQEQESPDDDHANRIAMDLVDQLGALKGVVMKVGQMASYLPGSLPAQAQQILTQLQDQSAGLTFDKVQAVIEQEFNQPLSESFDEFSEEPFAAASIGQVHRAKLGGQEVVVKIQYPDIEELLRGDLKTLEIFTKISTMGLPLDGGALVEELRQRTLEECDYQQEAKNQTLFGKILQQIPGSSVPSVVAERTTKRVITSSFVDAQPFYAFAKKANVEQRNAAGTIVFQTCFDCIFRHCIYNADPHPGNYLFSPAGQVTFLDFGCIRRFEPEMIDCWKKTALSVLDNDRAAFQKHYVTLGFVPNPKKFDWDHQWEVMHYLYKPFMQKTPFTYTNEYVRQSYNLVLFKNPNQRKTGMPPEWLFLNRLQWGLNAVLAHLQATGPWPEIWRAAVESKTQPFADT
jgi:predicted unusual protein kinase regulating ubiquinone biosynthesis (AarF/ABC1/UbiB family)